MEFLTMNLSKPTRPSLLSCLFICLMLFNQGKQASGACQSCLVASAVARPRVENFFLHPSVAAAGASMSFAGAGAIALRNRRAQTSRHALMSMPLMPMISSISSVVVLRSLSKQTAMLIQPVALAATAFTLIKWTDSMIADKSKVKDADSEDEVGASSLRREKDIPVDGDEGSDKPLTSAMVSTIGIYKNFISPLLPPACRFLPTCSQYGVQAIEEFGPTKGSILTAWRLLRCSPFGGKGYDPPRWPPVAYTYSSY